ncbi:PAS domain S-box protein [Geomonas sp.]|uniref:PAS domain-containing sensor histidine kinase n=1 Tax=Geomonas sp. TaxID=2651584 RepID=UPI002B4626A4|nr:PAS domain S-box protein [Geomonas sp.]HJV36739.1 PAS domain S-box protein [Geomonas sp.]
MKQGNIVNLGRAFAECAAFRARCQSLLAKLRDGYLLLEPIFGADHRVIDARYLETNPAFERTTGLRSADLLGKCLSEVLPNLEQRWLDLLDTVVRTEEPQTLESYNHNTGRFYESICFPFENGLIVGFLRDVTERKRMEEELQASELRYRTVVEDETETISRFLPDGTYTFVNEVYCRVFGKTAEELIGQKWWPVAFPDDLAEIQSKLDAMSPANPVAVIENRVILANGEVRWMQFVNRNFYDQNGKLLETQAVGRDVTERRNAEEATRHYARRLLEQEEDLRREIASELHDEIGRELAVLSMELTMLKAFPPERLRERYQLTLEGALDKVSTINQSLRGLMGKLRPPVLEDFGLVSAVRWYANMVAKRCGLALELALEEIPRPSHDKELALYRIFQEALHNVEKHARATRVAVSVARDRGTIVLSLSDNGAGFDRQAVSSRQQLSNWGLTIMQERARAIGARFDIQTAPGQGTLVLVELEEEV